MSKRMSPGDRKASILEAAIEAAKANTFSGMRLHHVATAAECSNASVVAYYNTMQQMRRAVMRAAIKRGLLDIIANGVVTRDPTALKADKDLRDRALASLSN